MSKKLHNFERVIALLMNPQNRALGCSLLEGYQGEVEPFKSFKTYLLCVYCPCSGVTYSQCESVISRYYKEGRINLEQYRSLHGYFIALKKKGVLK